MESIRRDTLIFFSHADFFQIMLKNRAAMVAADERNRVAKRHRKLASHTVAGVSPDSCLRPEGTPDFRRPFRTVSFSHDQPGTACRANIPRRSATTAITVAGTSQSGWLLALTLALSPEEREQARAASGRSRNRELNPACGRFSFSQGEKVGMRAGVILNRIVPAQEKEFKPTRFGEL